MSWPWIRTRSPRLDGFTVRATLDGFASTGNHRRRKAQASELQCPHNCVEKQPPSVRLFGKGLLGLQAQLDEQNRGVDDDQRRDSEECEGDEAVEVAAFASPHRASARDDLTYPGIPSWPEYSFG